MFQFLKGCDVWPTSDVFLIKSSNMYDFTFYAADSVWYMYFILPSLSRNKNIITFIEVHKDIKAIEVGFSFR